ncbi:MAG TPA: hypothetical protein V6C97_11880 [Oculatellaceae cyanobacterium]
MISLSFVSNFIALDSCNAAFASNPDHSSPYFELYAATGHELSPKDWSTESFKCLTSPKSGVQIPESESVDFAPDHSETLNAISGDRSEIGSDSSKAAQPVAGANAEREAVAAVHSLDREIIKSLVEIQRLNTQFRIASTSQPRFRQYRQSTYVETNSGCTIGGTIDAMRLNYPNIHRPGTLFSVVTDKSATGVVTARLTSKLATPRRIAPALSQGVQEPQVVGNCVNIVGDMFELSLNGNQFLQQRKSGIDSWSFRRRVLAMASDLDAKIARRHDLARTISKTSLEGRMLATEGHLQHDLRDLLLIEYSQYHSSAIKLHIFQNAAYLLDIAKNGTGAAGGIISIEGNHLRLPKWSGSAALLTTISGTVILTIPFAGRVAGNWAGTVDRRIVSHDYGRTIAKNTSDAFSDRSQMINCLAEAAREDLDPGLNLKDTYTRLFAYSQLCDIMNDHEVNVGRLLERAKRALLENVVYAGVTGSTKVALGVCGMIGGWHYSTSPWMVSRLSAAGNTAYTAGTAFSLAENLRVLYSQQLTANRLRDEHLLPTQMYRERLNMLDAVDRKMKNGM